MEVREGGLLGGRIRYSQAAEGHRSGIEPVLLAAAVPATDGQVVIEGGCGAGAGLLCLAARVNGLSGTGIETVPALAALARINLSANGFDRCRVHAGDITAASSFGPADHAFANPPWHDPAGTASPDAWRDTARRAAPDVATTWCRSLAAALRPRGTLSLILPAARLSAWLAALTHAGCGSFTLLPLWPHPGQAAKLLILQALRGGAGPTRLLAGLTLHDHASGYTKAAEAVLRGGAAINLQTAEKAGKAVTF